MVVVWICGGLLAVGLVLLLIRTVIGPTVLDRAVSLDAVVSFIVIGLCLDAAVRRTTETLVILVALNLFAFLGSVAIARFVDPTRADDDLGGDS